jgi:hypothetical protein
MDDNDRILIRKERHSGRGGDGIERDAAYGVTFIDENGDKFSFWKNWSTTHFAFSSDN